MAVGELTSKKAPNVPIPSGWQGHLLLLLPDDATEQSEPRMSADEKNPHIYMQTWQVREIPSASESPRFSPRPFFFSGPNKKEPYMIGDKQTDTCTGIRVPLELRSLPVEVTLHKGRSPQECAAHLSKSREVRSSKMSGRDWDAKQAKEMLVTVRKMKTRLKRPSRKKESPGKSQTPCAAFTSCVNAWAG
jgi:hypothetical protein